MRVISGTARGTKLKTLDADTTRPTLDRVKESIFNIINKYIKDSFILDLFSGSGSLAIEALSRNAKQAVICENNKLAVQIIKDNLIKTKLLDKCTIIYDDYINCLEKIRTQNNTFDIIFLDPPYGKEMGVKAIKKIAELNLLKIDGIIVLETDKNEIVPNQIDIYNIYDERIYGKAKISFFRYGS